MQILKNMGLYASQFMDVWNGKLVLVSYVSNKVYVINPDSNELLKEIEICNIDCERTQFRSFCCYGNSVLLVPYNALDFRWLDLNSNSSFSIGDNITQDIANIKQKFYRTIRHGDYAYVLGEDVKKIIKVDLRSHSCSCICDYWNSTDMFWTSSYSIVDNAIFVPSRTKNTVMCINMQNDDVSFEKVEVKQDNRGFLDFYEKKGIFHLFTETGEEYLWNRQTGDVLLNENTMEKRFTSRQCFVFGNKVFRIALQRDELYCREGDSVFAPLNCGIKQSDVTGKDSRFQEGVQFGDAYYFQSRQGRIYRLDLETNLVEEIYLKETAEVKQTRASFFIQNSKRRAFRENEEYSLDEYIRLL